MNLLIIFCYILSFYCGIKIGISSKYKNKIEDIGGKIDYNSTLRNIKFPPKELYDFNDNDLLQCDSSFNFLITRLICNYIINTDEDMVRKFKDKENVLYNIEGNNLLLYFLSDKGIDNKYHLTFNMTFSLKDNNEDFDDIDIFMSLLDVKSLSVTIVDKYGMTMYKFYKYADIPRIEYKVDKDFWNGYIYKLDDYIEKNNNILAYLDIIIPNIYGAIEIAGYGKKY